MQSHIIGLNGQSMNFLSEGKCYDDTLQSQFYYPAMESFILCSPDLFVYSDCQTGATHDKKTTRRKSNIEMLANRFTK